MDSTICLCLFQQDLHPGEPMRPSQKLERLLTVALVVVAIVLVGAFIVVRTPAVAAQPITASILSTSSPVFRYKSASTVTSGLTASPTATYHPITWKELVNFLEKDHTNWNRYIPGKYTCLDFSMDLVANAGKQDIQAWIVAVDFKSGGIGHAFVAFATSDRGIVYVEPQADDTYPIVQVGRPLCDSWGVYECMGTVASIQYVQCYSISDCVLYKP
jgi:hypothetical protein